MKKPFCKSKLGIVRFVKFYKVKANIGRDFVRILKRQESRKEFKSVSANG